MPTMTLSNKLIAVLLSFALVFSFTPSVALADEGTNWQDSEETAIENENIDMGENVLDAASGSESESQDGAADEDVSDNEASTTETVTGLESTVGSDENNATGSVLKEIVDPNESLAYLFADSQVVALGDEQTIAVGLKDEAAQVSSAKIKIMRSGDAKEFEFEANSIANNAFAFTFLCDGDLSVSSYQIIEVSYCLDGATERHIADFGLVDENERYSFEVVDQEVASALESVENSDSDTTAMVLDEDGSLQAFDSVEEAITVANPSQSIEAQSSDQAKARSVVSGTREDYLIVAINAGHGGTDSGAAGNGLLEKNLNLSIAQYMRDELNTYTGVSAYMVRDSDEAVGLQERVNRAKKVGADVFVSIHINSGGGTGAEVWVPNDASYNEETHTVGVELGGKIAQQLEALGLTLRGETDGVAGVKVRDGSSIYPDGSTADYYSDIRNSRLAGFTGIIVEHAFIDRASDASKLSQASFRKQLGQADATGVAQYYGLGKAAEAQASSLVSVKSHVANLGWENEVYDGKVSGTIGKGFGLEAFQLNLQNAAAEAGGITYSANVNGEWQDWVADGETAGTTGNGTALEAIKIDLTGDAKNQYDVYYRVHSASLGWLGWAKNGESAGTVGLGYDAQAIEVVIVSKGSSAPGDTSGAFIEGNISYSTHVQTYGWQSVVYDGATSGTTGEAKRLEAIKISLANTEYSGSIQYRTHVQSYGWEDGWKSDGAMSGTSGEAKRLEAIQVQLTGDIAEHYDVYYRVHAQKLGWMGWAKNGESAGTTGYAYRLEAIQIQLVPKGSTAPGSTDNAFEQAGVSYSTHVQTYGWQSVVYDGATSGTTGEAKRLEAIKISLANTEYSGSIQYRTHVQSYGWEDGWKSDGAMSGTSGEAKRLEAIQVQLTGDIAEHYDVYYRVHAQKLGWMGWAKNGESAGTTGYAYRLEAIQIQLVPKGSTAPGSTDNAFDAAPEEIETPIMGLSLTTVDQMVRYYESAGHDYPSAIYASKGASSIEEFCQLVYEEARMEGVRAEVLFCQAMKETGWLQFGGSVQASQCNFGGLGAVESSASGASFSNVREGLRAQTQHLKAYASTLPLVNGCVDPRFNLVARGIAPNLEDLNGRWAVPGTTYGQEIREMVDRLLVA